MRTFSGAEQFDALKQTVVGAYTKLFPVKNQTGYTLELRKVWVDDSGLNTADYSAQKKAKLAGNTWGAPVYAAIDLKDPTGKLVDHMDQVRLSTIPRLTPRGSYLVSGNEYQVSNQLRRKPGVYVVKRATGDQYKANFNLGGESSKNFELHLDPASQKYTVDKIAGSQGSIPLYPLLHALGVSDTELQKQWGSEVLAANKTKTDATAVLKFAQKFTGVKTDSVATATDELKKWVQATKLDPHITELTLGKPHSSLSTDTLLTASQKLLNVYAGKAQADDPESLLFKEVLGVEDMLHDWLNAKGRVNATNYMLSRHLGKRMKIKDIIDFKKLSSPVESFFKNDDRVSTPEQYNPMQMISNVHKLTLMGTGGIRDPHTLTSEIREVHPTQVGFVDPVHSPEGSKIGATLHLTAGLLKDGRELRTQVYNTKTHKLEFLSPRELYQKTVAFPDEAVLKDGKAHFKTGEVRAQLLGQVKTVKPTDVDYVFATHTQLFSPSTNMIPFLHNDQGTRAMMAAKHLEQAIPLVEREAPLVQTNAGNGTTFQKEVGQQFTVKAPQAGVVTDVKPDYIEIDKKTRVPVYNHFPLNQKTFIHHEPVVKVGDIVKAGQMLAESNFTKGGTLALGKNLKVAYLPYPGLTFEDGVVITESGAKKLATQQLYKHTFELDPGRRKTSLKTFSAYFPNAVAVKQLMNYDSEGVIKKGTAVQPGQVMIMGLNDNLSSPEHATLKRINKSLAKPWGNAAVRYTGEFPGVVTDVVQRADKIEVFVKATENARESDKISGVHGNKGVITRVIPDAEAPRNTKGEIPDVFLNPHGIISRMNLGQMYESAASKIALKEGKPYVVTNFSGEDSSKKLTAELAAHGISDQEEMVLPNGKAIGKVSVGNPYILRLAKTGKTGFSARMPGSGYDLNMQPTKGGEEGTKSLDLMTFYCMLSHGAKKNLLDAHMKSEKNDELWHAIETGKSLPSPQPSFAWNKFMGLLRGAGINPIKQGPEITLAPMTDTEVKKLSRGEIKDYNFLYGKNLREIPGSLFDKQKTGGLFGTNYTHLELKEVLPNPIFEKAIRSLTGLSDHDYEGILNGSKHVMANGAIGDKSAAGSLTAGPAIHRLLSQIDVDKMSHDTQLELKKVADNPTKLNLVSRKLRYLSALKELNLKPQEAYTRKLIPVVPPIHRPIYEMGNRGLQVAPANLLYQNVGILNEAQDLEVMKLLGDEDKQELRQDLYKSTRALAGLEPVIQKSREQVPIHGFMEQIAGSNPKSGFFLQKVVSKRQDLVGRGVVTNAPDLHVDQLGIPEKMAWKIFRPFVIREFTQSGVDAATARKEMDEQTPRAKKMLESTMAKRTVMMNRAPSLHKFNVLAFKPVLSEGLAIRVPPLVMKGFNMDVDGDAVQLHVPISEEAIKESHTMFPSKNLFKPGTGELMLQPSQEAAIGLYFLSQTPAGREKINSLLPQKFHITGALESKQAKEFYNRVAHEAPQEFSKLVSDMKSLGDKTAYERGFSVGLKDIAVSRAARDRIFHEADMKAKGLEHSMKPGLERDNKIASLYEHAAKDSYADMEKGLKASSNNFYHMVSSGARGTKSQLMQMLAAPGTLEDAKSRKIPVPVKKSYAEGLSTGDYFISAYGVRKGMMDKSLQTSQPGALNKDIMASTLDNIITADDCGVKRGLRLPTGSPDARGRLLAHDHGSFKRNTLVTPQVISELEKKGIKEIEVRTPLKCVAHHGTCASCFGLDEFDKLPQIGDNIGVKAGQAMSEPMTQMAMKCTVSNIVFKYHDRIYSRSMQDIFDIIDSPIILVDGIETKTIDDGFVWDVNGWMHAEVMQRHKPETAVHFVKTDSGDAILVQSDHPIYAYRQPKCECGKPGDTVRYHTKEYTVTECCICKRVVTHPKRIYKQTETVKNAAQLIEKEDCLWLSRRLVEHEVAPLEIDAYTVGFYLAEGCVRRGDTGKYNTLPVAALFSQYHETIRNYLYERMIASGIKATNRPKEVAVYNTTFAAKIADLCPGYAHEKRMNFDFLFLPLDYLADLFCGLIDGDGTVACRNNDAKFLKFYSSSFILAQQLTMVACRLGIPYNFGKATKPVNEKINHVAQPYYVEFSIDHNLAYLLRNSLKVRSNLFFGALTYKNPVVNGVSKVTINQPISSDYPFFTYDIKTKSASFCAGFIRNHNSFHTGGVSSGTPIAAGFERVQQLLRMPDYVAGEAALSKTSGHVKSIKKLSTGGHEIQVGTEMHAVRPGLEPIVKVGDVVSAGDVLTQGVIKPQNLIKYKGMQKAQDYIVDELHKAYHAQGIPMQRKIFETVVRSVGNLTKVLNSPKQSDFAEGDVIPWSAAVHYNETRLENRPTNDAQGYHLLKPIGVVAANKPLTDKDVSYLQGLGHQKLDVVKEPLLHAPILKGIERLPLEKKDVLAQLGYRYIKETLTQGASQGWKSNLEGNHPIPAFAYGASFGKKKEHY